MERRGRQHGMCRIGAPLPSGDALPRAAVASRRRPPRPWWPSGGRPAALWRTAGGPLETV